MQIPGEGVTCDGGREDHDDDSATKEGTAIATGPFPFHRISPSLPLFIVKRSLARGKIAAHSAILDEGRTERSIAHRVIRPASYHPRGISRSERKTGDEDDADGHAFDHSCWSINYF